MFYKKSLSIATLALLSAGSGLGAVELIEESNFTTGFESSEGYTEGYLVSDTIWDVIGTTYPLIHTSGLNNTFGVELSASAELALEFTSNFSNSVGWIDFYVKPAFGPSSDLPVSFPLGQAGLTGFVKVGSDGEIFILNGDGAGNGEWLSSGYVVALDGNIASDWLRITYRLDYANQHWDLFLNNELKVFDLGFIDANAAPLSGFSIAGSTEGATQFDQFEAGFLNPLYTDADNDGIADSYEAANGLNASLDDRESDSDNDTISNIEEYFSGLLAGTADTDSDGVHDGQEVRQGNDPLVADVYSLNSLPFSTSFESAALGTSIAGVNLWAVENGTATVQNSEVASGAQALELSALANQTAVLSNQFDGSAYNQVWIDFQIRPVFWGTGDGPDVSDFLYAPLGVFYFNENDQVTYLNGDGQGSGTWETVAVTLDSAQWQRVTIFNDYTAQTWSLWLNGVRIAQNIGFAHPQPYFNHLAFQQGDEASAFLDDLSAAPTEPSALDNDGDTLSNDFERTNSAYGFNPDNAADVDLDIDQDGLGTAQELALGTSFDVSDSDTDGLLDGVEVFNGEDPLVIGTYNTLTDNGSGVYTWSTDFEVAESYASGGLDGQDLWRANSAEASISNTVSQSGTQALALSSAGSEPAIAEQILVTPETQTTVWVSFQAQLNSGELPELADPATLGAFIMTRDPSGNLVVLDGSNLSWIDTDLALADATWARFDCRLDYDSKTWDLYVDYVLIEEDVSFVNPNLPVLSAIQFEQDKASEAVNIAYIDALRISTAIPDALKGNWVNVPDTWKQLIVDADPNDALNNISLVISTDDFDGDGTDNATEYAQGRLATVADADVNVYVDASVGDNSYSGLSAVPNMPTSADGPKANLANALTATSNAADIVLVQSGIYEETTLSLNGQDRILRLNGSVTIR